MRKEAQQLALLAFVASLPLPIIFAAQGPTLIAAVFGNQFLPALSTCLILMFGQCLNAAAGMASALLVMNGYEGQVIRVVGTAFIINLVLNLLLVPYFMADGAALATVISILVVNILLLRLAARRLRIDASIFGMLANKT